MKRKRYIAILLLCGLLSSLPYHAAFAAERVARMTVPGCAS